MVTLHSGEPMRLALHPGAPLHDRATSVAVTAMAQNRIMVAAGADLFATINDELDSLGATGGAFVLVAGQVERLTIMTGGPGRDGMPMGFCGPHRLHAPLTVMAGAGGSGVDENGERFSHCHAAFNDDAGRLVGGHLLPGETIAGEGGITLDLVALSGGRFVRRLDPETQFTIFHPEPA